MRVIIVLALGLVAAAAHARPADDGIARPAAASEVPGEPLSEVLRGLDAILLAGEALPPGFLHGLASMPPAERLLAVAYARRAGLLTGPALPLAEILAEARR